MENKLEQLLDEVFVICKHHKELSAATGELFNIFSLLGVESAEVRMHSRLLVELLNPKGSHGLDDAFLKLFLAQFRIEDLDSEGAEAEAEFYIGPKTETTGGRIDILMSANKKHVIIENKIYAGDQENQLLRYHNYDQFARLLYLTLHGNEPTQLSTGTLDKEKYECISYEKDILKWLEACKKEAANFPLVRETIAQYINLIKMLTNQNRSNKMNDEIIEAVLKDSNRLTAFFDLRKAEGPVLTKVFEKLKSDVNEIAARLGLALNFYVTTETFSGFSFSNSAMKDHGVEIAFSFEAKGNQELIFGFGYLDHKITDKTPSNLLTKFNEVYVEGKKSDYWPCYAYWQGRRGWTDETYKEIYFGNGKLKNEIEEKVREMLKVFESAHSAS